tara:strand:+ start:2101 stop:2319 length:219 start_codon:yes stop_codon:yes gene_type:complete
MIRKKEKQTGPMIIDLTGPRGNAFYLLGTAKNLAITLDLDADAIHEEMTASDYENLIQVFDKYFGDLVTLER